LLIPRRQAEGAASGIACVLAAWCLVVAAPTLLAQNDEQGVYIRVPFRRQVGLWCGTASLAMVLEYWGRPTDQQRLAQSLPTPAAKGLTGEELRELAREEGFFAEALAADPEFLLRQLTAGRPLILLIDAKSPSQTGHYVVVVGWDALRRQWLVHDPTLGPYRRFDDDGMRRRWGSAGGWTLLIVPKDRR
jgi:ABC-type bacteriocin/lantibiotic exporter with double-glycine peptidase domain